MDNDEYFERTIDEINNKISQNKEKVIGLLSTPYNWPEFDPQRHEISCCLLLGLNQASITLTNHFLENFLKTMLVYRDSIEQNESIDLIDSLKLGLSKFDKMNLSETISRSKRQGLITKSQAKLLDTYREEYRNPYSHAEKTKLFKDAYTKIKSIKLNQDLEYEMKESNHNISELIFASGMFLAKISESIAYNYFLKVDSIVRDSLKRFMKE